MRLPHGHVYTVYATAPASRAFFTRRAARWYAWRVRRFGMRTTLYRDGDTEPQERREGRRARMS